MRLTRGAEAADRGGRTAAADGQGHISEPGVETPSTSAAQAPAAASSAKLLVGEAS